jgi:basic membrane protein A
LKHILTAATAVIALAIGVGSANAADKLKACWMYVGPHNDGGYSEGHDVGRQMVEKELGDKVETSYVESIAEGPDAERALERLARSGCQIIFSTSFGFMDPTIKVAAKFPDVKFEHATGFKTAPNVGTYNARFYEGRYIAGQIAAKQSKAGVAGYIVSFPIPEVVMGINAFMLGAQSINPDFKIKVVWVNSWFDPAKEADAAKALFDQGADIITQHTDSPAPLQIAQERGLHGFGQAHDMYKFAPKAQYTAIVDTWGPYYVKRVNAVLDGSWKAEQIWDGLKDGILHMADYTNLPDDVVASAKKTQAEIEAGTLHPFKGPVFKQDGTEAVGEGKNLDDATLLSMNWYVKGIDDQLPK